MLFAATLIMLYKGEGKKKELQEREWAFQCDDVAFENQVE